MYRQTHTIFCKKNTADAVLQPNTHYFLQEKYNKRIFYRHIHTNFLQEKIQQTQFYAEAKRSRINRVIVCPFTTSKGLLARYCGKSKRNTFITSSCDNLVGSKGICPSSRNSEERPVGF